MLYVKDLLAENLQLNLLDVHVDEENHYIPNLIVIHPDYLIDIQFAGCLFPRVRASSAELFHEQGQAKG